MSFQQWIFHNFFARHSRGQGSCKTKHKTLFPAMEMKLRKFVYSRMPATYMHNKLLDFYQLFFADYSFITATSTLVYSANLPETTMRRAVLFLRIFWQDLVTLAFQMCPGTFPRPTWNYYRGGNLHIRAGKLQESLKYFMISLTHILTGQRMLKRVKCIRYKIKFLLKIETYQLNDVGSKSRVLLMKVCEGTFFPT